MCTTFQESTGGRGWREAPDRHRGGTARPEIGETAVHVLLIRARGPRPRERVYCRVRVSSLKLNQLLKSEHAMSHVRDTPTCHDPERPRPTARIAVAWTGSGSI